MNSLPRVLVSGFSPAQIEEIKRAVPEIKVMTALREELGAKVADADALIGAANPDLIRAGKKLRWVQVFDAGIEDYSFPELVNSNIVLTNTKIIQAPEIADHAMALLLALTRNLHRVIRSRDMWETKDSWERVYPEHRPIELRGKTALIIGLGGIGTQIADRVFGFGMEVLGVDPRDVPFFNSVKLVYKPDQLGEALPRANVVFVAAPHTRETAGILGVKEFALMKQGAYLIAVSRGKTIQTEALVQALKDGRLAGAGLDVTDPEPLPKDHPLWSFDNVVITPHIAALSDNNRGRRFELIKDNIRRFARGLPLRNVVNKGKGY